MRHITAECTLAPSLYVCFFPPGSKDSSRWRCSIFKTWKGRGLSEIEMDVRISALLKTFKDDGTFVSQSVCPPLAAVRVPHQKPVLKTF